MSSTREPEAKANEIRLVEPREIVTAFLMHWRKPIVVQAQDFIQNPNEEAFFIIRRRLLATLNKRELTEWSSFINDLIKQEKSRAITPAEQMLIGYAYFMAKGVGLRHDTALEYFSKARASSNIQTSIIALTLLAMFHEHGDRRLGNQAEAIKLYREAREKGGRYALCILAGILNQPDLYIESMGKECPLAYAHRGRYLHGLEKFDQAYGCFVDSAMLGEASGVHALAIMFFQGNYLMQDKNQAAFLFRLADTRICSYQADMRRYYREKMRVILKDTREESRFFVEYQLAMLEQDTTRLSKLAKQDSIQFLQCVTDSCDLWDEISPLLKKEVLATIEKLLMQAVSALRNVGINGDVTAMTLNYLWPEDLNKAVIGSENKCHVKELDDQAAKREREMLHQIEKREQQSARFDKSVAALIAKKGRDVVRADTSRAQDTWFWAQPNRDVRSKTRW